MGPQSRKTEGGPSAVSLVHPRAPRPRCAKRRLPRAWGGCSAASGPQRPDRRNCHLQQGQMSVPLSWVDNHDGRSTITNHSIQMYKYQDSSAGYDLVRTVPTGSAGTTYTITGSKDERRQGRRREHRHQQRRDGRVPGSHVRLADREADADRLASSCRSSAPPGSPDARRSYSHVAPELAPDAVLVIRDGSRTDSHNRPRQPRRPQKAAATRSIAPSAYRPPSSSASRTRVPSGISMQSRS
jgi:hypothetical protein